MLRLPALGVYEGIQNHMTILEKQFKEFDEANPNVWGMFQHFTNELIEKGHKKLSASLVTERIRWESMVKTSSKDGFKISNNHRAYYARKWNELNNSDAKFTSRVVRGQEVFGYEW